MTYEQLNDRFDRYEALYVLCVRWHSGQRSRGYRLLSRLHRAGYRPGLAVERGELSDGGLEYYWRWFHLRGTL